MFKDHPFVGVGLGHYKLNFLPYKAKLLPTTPSTFLERRKPTTNTFRFSPSLAYSAFLPLLLCWSWYRSPFGDGFEATWMKGTGLI